MNNHCSMVPISTFLIFITFFSPHAEAQNLSGTATDSPDSITNFQPSLAVVIGILSIMFSLTFILLLYAKFCHRASSGHSLGHQIRDSLVRSRSRASGLDKTVVESLPFFRFSSLRGLRDGLECSVCLAKFEDAEVLRLLPKCKHAFHMDCIDQWLEKHSTCPLCRHKVSSEDLPQLPCPTSLRLESNLELYVEREESRHGSSRFSIGSSFRKAVSDNEESLPIPQNMDSEVAKKPLHKHNHRIDVVLKHRWSNVSSSDLIFLNSEMLDHASSARFSSLSSRNRDAKAAEITQDDHVMNLRQEMERKRVFESKLREIRHTDPHSFPGLTKHPSDSDSPNSLNHNEQRSMSEIIAHPRFGEPRIKDSCLSETDVKQERTRRIWLPIARKTVQWFANRERVLQPHPQGLNLQRPQDPPV